MNITDHLDKTLRELLLEASLSSTGTRYFCMRTGPQGEAVCMALFTVDPHVVSVIDQLLDPKTDVVQRPL